MSVFYIPFSLIAATLLIVALDVWQRRKDRR
jgi:hypothetical protein